LTNGDIVGSFLVYFIVFIGMIFRLLFINKPDGLWNDEYVSWMISQKPLFDGFIQGILSQCHMPFYYLYLKFFTKILGNSDVVLRLTSVLAGVISVWVMYLVGRVKDKKTGMICAGFCAISPFLIYYSQEVRMYSVLFLFSALSLLFTLKLVKRVSRKHIIGYILSNFLILFTHTIGFIYVFFNLLYVSLKLFKSYKKQIYILWSTIVISFVAFLPLVAKIFTEKTFSQWWGVFTPAKIGFVLTDYLSPVLTNLTNSPNDFFYNVSVIFIVFCIIPSIICLTLLAKSLFEKENRGLFYIALCTLSILIIAAITGKMVLLTKYSIEIYPIIIYLVCVGLSQLKHKGLMTSTILLLCFLNFAYFVISPVAAQKIRRAEGHKIAATLLSDCKLKTGDYVILEYYSQDRFEKYFDFSNYNVISINKGNFPEFINKNITYADVYKNGRELYKPYFEKSGNQYFDDKINNEIIKKMKIGQKLVILSLDSVSLLNEDQLKSVSQNQVEYSRIPLPFLVFSYIKNEVAVDASKRLDISYIESKGSWSVAEFTKLNY
jgi:hypothetical protein